MKTRAGSTTAQTRGRSRSGSTSAARRSTRPKVSNQRRSAQKSRGTPRRSTIRVNRTAELTVDHDEIRRWVEERGGIPAVVKRTHRGKQGGGILRIDFPGFSGERSLEHISWDEWFKIFNEQKLAFLFQREKVTGEPSTFNKLVSCGELC